MASVAQPLAAAGLSREWLSATGGSTAIRHSVSVHYQYGRINGNSYYYYHSVL